MFWSSHVSAKPLARPFVADAPPWWQFAAVLALALLVQSTLAPFVSLRGATVSFVLLVVLWYGLRAGTGPGLLAGLIAGAGEDALGASAPAWTFATALCGGLAGRFSGSILGESRAFVIAAVVVATLVRYAAFALVLQLAGHPLALPQSHFHALLWQSVLDALGATLVLALWPGVLGSDGRHS